VERWWSGQRGLSGLRLRPRLFAPELLLLSPPGLPSPPELQQPERDAQPVVLEQEEESLSAGAESAEVEQAVAPEAA